MSAGAQRRIVVVGAGIVGICCALWLTRNGHRVLLVDGNEPGTGASSGSACTIAVHGCVPVNCPDLIANLPKLLFDALLGQPGPLRIDPLYAARHIPWFWRFLRHCRAAEVEKISAALGQLLSQARAGLEPLISMAGCGHLLVDNGCLYAYQSEQDFIADRANLRTRRRHGVRHTELDAAALREIEPRLKMRFARGVLFDDSQSVLNPQSLAHAFFDCFRRHGGRWRQQNARAIRHRNDHLEVLLADGARTAADKVVLAGGAFSTRVEGSGAEQLPLLTERGYHIQFGGRQALANRPIHWVGSGFYAVPTADGLRFAGTVEMAGLSPAKNRKMLNYLTRMAGRMFEIEGKPDQVWLGYRPTFPDALPVIGASARSADVLLAFGHQHVGLTLAGITGKIIAQLVDGEPTTADIAPFSAARFC